MLFLCKYNQRLVNFKQFYHDLTTLTNVISNKNGVDLGNAGKLLFDEKFKVIKISMSIDITKCLLVRVNIFRLITQLRKKRVDYNRRVWLAALNSCASRLT